MDPVRDLLIWAIVQNRKELADIIWTQVNSSAPKLSWLAKRMSIQSLCGLMAEPSVEEIELYQWSWALSAGHWSSLSWLEQYDIE